MSANEVEVLVVGGGPVGLTAACELLRHGVACRIIETLERRCMLSKAATLHARTLEDLDIMNVAEEAARRGRKVTGTNLFAGDRRLTRVPFDSMDSVFNFVLGFEQSETEELLGDKLHQLGGCLERGVTLDSFTLIERDGQGRQGAPQVRAELLHTDGRREIVEARWLLGCDGASSTVRRGLGMSLTGFTYPQRVIHADVRVDWPPAMPGFELLRFMHREGAVSAVPLLSEGRYRLVVMLDENRREQPDRATFQQIVDQRACAGVRIHEPVWSVEHRFHRRLAPAFRRGPVFLLGDAAHIMAPVGGMGMNTGIQDAVNLIWKLALVSRGCAADQLLDTYEDERRPVARAAQELSERRLRGQYQALPAVDRALHTTGSPRAEPRKRTGGGMRALLEGIAKMRKELAQSTGMTEIHYPVSSIVVDDEDSRGGGLRAGVHAVDGQTIDSDGHRDRLLARCRSPRHTLLLFAGHDAFRDNVLTQLRPLQVRHRSAGLHVFLLLQNGQSAPDAISPDRVLWDLTGTLHRRYGVACCVLRPDHYLGLCSQALSVPGVDRYFAGFSRNL